MVDDFRSRAARLRILFLDVDGVLTDAGMYYSGAGEELKKFNTRDGMGIAMLQQAGVVVAIVTRENSEIVLRRAAKLGIQDVCVGIVDKLQTVRDLLGKYQFSPSEAGFVGDDVNDYNVMKHVGFGVSVADGNDVLREVEHYRTKHEGGSGAVREVCDLILEVKGISVIDMFQ